MGTDNLLLAFWHRCLVFTVTDKVSGWDFKHSFNKNSESGQHCLIPDLRGKAFILVPLSMMLAVGLSHTAFITLKYIPSLPNLLRVIKGCWILSTAFSLSTERIIWFYPFILLIWFITFMDLYMLNHPCIPGINPTWPFKVLWIQFAIITLRIFHLCSSGILARDFPSYSVLVWLW